MFKILKIKKLKEEEDYSIQIYNFCFGSLYISDGQLSFYFLELTMWFWFLLKMDMRVFVMDKCLDVQHDSHRGVVLFLIIARFK